MTNARFDDKNLSVRFTKIKLDIYKPTINLVQSSADQGGSKITIPIPQKYIYYGNRHYNSIINKETFEQNIISSDKIGQIEDEKIRLSSLRSTHTNEKTINTYDREATDVALLNHTLKLSRKEFERNNENQPLQTDNNNNNNFNINNDCIRKNESTILREDIEKAIKLYNFDINKLSEYCNVPPQIFIKWLRGELDSNKNNKNIQLTKMSPADQISEKMNLWLSEFIEYGFNNKKYLKFVSYLIPIEINEIINGQTYKKSFVWDINDSENELNEFINCLCNGLKQCENEQIKQNLYTSINKQIEINNKKINEYNISLNKSFNYLQHLKNNNSLILIKLNINHGQIGLIYEFYWNINDINNEIEQFANELCSDHRLPFNFSKLIAIEIRKQINEYKIKMTKYMNNNNCNNLNIINDPIAQPQKQNSFIYNKYKKYMNKYWICGKCTFVNPNSNLNCMVCCMINDQQCEYIAIASQIDGKFKNTIPMDKSITENDKKMAQQLKPEGNKLLGQKQYQTAIDKYTAAFKYNPQNAVYYSNRATAYTYLRNYKQAVIDAKKASDIDPNYVKAYVRQGLAEYEMGNYEAAHESYSQTLSKTKSTDENWETYMEKVELCQMKMDEANNNTNNEKEPKLQSLKDDGLDNIKPKIENESNSPRFVYEPSDGDNNYNSEDYDRPSIGFSQDTESTGHYDHDYDYGGAVETDLITLNDDGTVNLNAEVNYAIPPPPLSPHNPIDDDIKEYQPPLYDIPSTSRSPPQPQYSKSPPQSTPNTDNNNENNCDSYEDSQWSELYNKSMVLPSVCPAVNNDCCDDIINVSDQLIDNNNNNNNNENNNDTSDEKTISNNQLFNTQLLLINSDDINNGNNNDKSADDHDNELNNPILNPYSNNAILRYDPTWTDSVCSKLSYESREILFDMYRIKIELVFKINI